MHLCRFYSLLLEMHPETESPAQADIFTRFRYISCPDNSETGGSVVPTRPSDHRDVRLFLVIVTDPEEPEAILCTIAGKGSLHCHYMAAVILQAGDKNSLQIPSQGQAKLFLAMELLVDDGHRAGPERSWPRQGAQPGSGLADWAMAGEDGVL